MHLILVISIFRRELSLQKLIKLNVDNFNMQRRKILVVCTTGLGNFINFTHCIKSLYKNFDIEILVDERKGFYETIKKWKYFDKVWKKHELDNKPLDKYYKIIFSIFSEYRSSESFLKECKKHNPVTIPLDLDKKDKIKHETSLNRDSLIKQGFNIKDKSVFFDFKKTNNDLKEEYVVFSPSCKNTGRWIKKRWNPKKWKKLEKYFEGKGFKVIFVGLKKDYNENLLNQIDTSFLGIGLDRTAQIIKNCKIFIGIDGGLSHLAGALDKNPFVLFGPADWRRDSPKNAICIYKKSKCPYSPCLSKPQGAYIMNKCENPVCMDSIEIKDVKRKLRKFKEFE